MVWVASELTDSVPPLEAFYYIVQCRPPAYGEFDEDLHCVSLDFVFRAQHGVSVGVC